MKITFNRRAVFAIAGTGFLLLGAGWVATYEADQREQESRDRQARIEEVEREARNQAETERLRLANQEWEAHQRERQAQEQAAEQQRPIDLPPCTEERPGLENVYLAFRQKAVQDFTDTIAHSSSMAGKVIVSAVGEKQDMMIVTYRSGGEAAEDFLRGLLEKPSVASALCKDAFQGVLTVQVADDMPSTVKTAYTITSQGAVELPEAKTSQIQANLQRMGALLR